MEEAMMQFHLEPQQMNIYIFYGLSLFIPILYFK